MQMSKSGVFAHFGSREDLQVEVVREYHRRFEDEVFFPSLREPRGLPRLRAMISRWIEKRIQEVTTGCIYISGAVEYDDRADSQVREQLASSVTTGVLRSPGPFRRQWKKGICVRTRTRN
jgi:AcrR family transcriptional regulator